MELPLEVEKKKHALNMPMDSLDIESSSMVWKNIKAMIVVIFDEDFLVLVHLIFVFIIIIVVI